MEERGPSDDTHDGRSFSEDSDADEPSCFDDAGKFEDDIIDDDLNDHDNEPSCFDDAGEFEDNVLDNDLNNHVAHDSCRAQPPRLSPKEARGIWEDFNDKFDFSSADGEDASSGRSRFLLSSTRRTSQRDGSISTVGRTTSTGSEDESDMDEGLSTSSSGQSGSSTDTEDASHGTSDCNASSAATSERTSSPKSSNSSGSNGHSGNIEFMSKSEASEQATRQGKSNNRGNAQAQGARRDPKWSPASSDAKEDDAPHCPMDPPSSNDEECNEGQCHQSHGTTETSDG